jgi:plasmid stabilization system protein ParE
MAEPVVELSSAAIKDIEAAVEWYDSRSPRLGDEFLDRLDAVFRRVTEQPLIYREVDSGVRRGLMEQFPYAVYYVPNDVNVVVLAVLHTSRRPDYWKDRDE